MTQLAEVASGIAPLVTYHKVPVLALSLSEMEITVGENLALMVSEMMTASLAALMMMASISKVMMLVWLPSETTTMIQ